MNEKRCERVNFVENKGVPKYLYRNSYGSLTEKVTYFYQSVIFRIKHD